MTHPQIFLSYPRVHVRLVSLLAHLLRVGNVRAFQDITAIEPGDDWEVVLVTSIEAATTVVVFWCDHSLRSTWVNREIDLALKGEKRIVPLLLDKTPMPQKLARFHGIDFASEFHHPAAKRAIVQIVVGVLTLGLVGTLLWIGNVILASMILVIGVIGLGVTELVRRRNRDQPSVLPSLEPLAVDTEGGDGEIIASTEQGSLDPEVMNDPEGGVALRMALAIFRQLQESR
jgi:hypothetical protein